MLINAYEVVMVSFPADLVLWFLDVASVASHLATSSHMLIQFYEAVMVIPGSLEY